VTSIESISERIRPGLVKKSGQGKALSPGVCFHTKKMDACFRGFTIQIFSENMLRLEDNATGDITVNRDVK
jgi:hypothetical protein